MWHFPFPFECQNWETIHNWGVVGMLQHILWYESLWKRTSYVIFIPTPNTTVNREHVTANLLRDKSLHIYGYLFLTMVLPLGSTAVYGATIHLQNISKKQVSGTNSRFPFDFFQPAFHILHNYKDYLVLVFLCVFQDSNILQELVRIPPP